MINRPPKQAVDPRLIEIMQCPRCRTDLQVGEASLSCAAGHQYPIVDGVPVFLFPDRDQTIGIATASYHAAQSGGGGPLYIDTLALPADDRAGVASAWRALPNASSIDPAITYLLGATCGHGYRKLIGRAATYPIPRIPLPRGAGELLLDLGCSWGRWSISAARQGWRVVGIDPSLGAIMAARRAFGDERGIMFVCGDGRFLPFKDNSFASAFSYSVVQHFSEADADVALAEIGRVLNRNGVARIQMAHRHGLRSTYVRTRPDYSRGGHFRVRYWSLSQMKDCFTKNIGPSTIIPEAFGGLGLLREDYPIVSAKSKVLICISTLLKNIARVLKPLILVADSVYVVAVKR